MTLELPTTGGVYAFTQTFESALNGEKITHSVLAQLDDTGQWWPFPYMFSGWRNSELETFDSVTETDAGMDYPAIKNPDEKADADLKKMAKLLRGEFGISKKAARKKALRLYNIGLQLVDLY